MSLFPQPAIIGASEYSKGYPLEDSLRLRSSASAYLSRTPTSTGNRKTWTWSGWVKRSKLTAFNPLFQANHPSVPWFVLGFANNDKIEVTQTAGSSASWESTAVFRDVSAWYHVVLAVDTTSATSTMAGSSTDRFRLYVNGTQYVISGGSVPSQNADLQVNNTVAHTIGGYGSNFTDGYITEVNFIDGQALDPSYFGETDVVTGVWKPKKYTGTYGTNGFYLPMTPTSQASGFNTVIWPSTNGVPGYITNVGFSPDFIWGKSRDNVQNHHLVDSIRGGDKVLFSNLTNTEATNANAIISFDSDGFTYGTSSAFTNGSMVAWCWDAGSGSPASNTDGSITSTVKANQAKGFSIVTYTGNGSAGATWGHGLGVAPNFIMIKARDVIDNWMTKHSSYPSNLNFIELNTTNALGSATDVWNNTAPTSSVVTVGTGQTVNKNASSYVAYCFSEVAGYSKFGSYTGNGSSSGPTITTGFRPAWLLVKCSTAAYGWQIVDLVRNPSNPMKNVLFPHASAAEDSTTGYLIADSLDNGFQITSTNNTSNQNGQTYIYMAIADTRNTAFNNDASGNQNNWTPNNINSNASGQSTYDLMKDVPTLTDADAGNFCTLNPLDKNWWLPAVTTQATISQANLNASCGAVDAKVGSTISVLGGKYYAEVTINSQTITNIIVSGYAPTTFEIAYINDGNKSINRIQSAYGATYTGGDLIGIAVDAPNNQVTFYKNGVSQGVITNTFIGDAIFIGAYLYNCNLDFNFGQRPFAYTPPTGYKALNTYNLPDPTIADGSLYFDNLLYTGNGSASKRTDIAWNNIQPDFVWVKNRSSATDHALHDDVRGVTSRLRSNTTAAESGPSGFGSDGFGYNGVGNEFRIFTADSSYNANGSAYVAWGWKASGAAGVSNTDGSITSTVSANTSSGFSVATYTGTGSAATIGHGLGIAPSMLIVKRRSDASTWAVYHASLGAGKKLELNGDSGAITNAQFFTSTPTSSVFSLGTEYDVNGSGGTFVCYAFATIEGYSSFGSYVGNGNADGTFVYLGFRPAVVISKKSSGIGDWQIQTSDIPGYNVVTKTLFPNYSIAEATNPNLLVDFYSNGFKWRATSGNTNGNGDTFIYAAFAENPFKYSLAR